MLLVAAGDEGIFDLENKNEGGDARRARLESSANFIIDAIHGAAAVPPPGTPSGTLLAAIARGWQELSAPLLERSHPALFAGWRRALKGLYEASVKEHDVAIIDSSLVRSLLEGDVAQKSAGKAIVERYGRRIPQILEPQLRALVDGVPAEPSRGAELRMFLYLIDAGNTIGAGLVFRTGALMARTNEVTASQIEAMEAVAEILNYRIRLSNDLSEIFAFNGKDRDCKETSCSMLVSSGLEDAARRTAIVDAVAAGRRVSAWLDGAVARAMVDLAKRWPRMAVLVRRAAFLGTRTYEVGHYKTISRVQMSAIFDEMEQREASS